MSSRPASDGRRIYVFFTVALAVFVLGIVAVGFAYHGFLPSAERAAAELAEQEAAAEAARQQAAAEAEAQAAAVAAALEAAKQRFAEAEVCQSGIGIDRTNRPARIRGGARGIGGGTGGIRNGPKQVSRFPRWRTSAN